MIRVLRAEAGGLREGGVALAVGGGVRWVDVSAPGPEDVAWLGETFGFHPLALEDCLHLDQRPKLEDYPSAVFLVLHTFTAPESDPAELDLHELHVFITEEVLVTVHADPLGPLEAVRARVSREPKMLDKGPLHLLHAITDAVVDAEVPVIAALHDAIDELEEQSLRVGGPDLVEGIFHVKRAVLRLRRTLSPAREVLLGLMKSRLGNGQVELYFRDVLDHALRNADAIEQARERLSDVLDAYHSTSAFQTNVVIKRLTLFSAVFLPLTFITGFFGMNFEHLPFGDDRFLAAALASMALLPAGLVALFWRMRWF